MQRWFCYIEDCVEAMFELMQPDYIEPLNLGQDRLVSINQLADMIAGYCRIKIIKTHIAGPQRCARSQLR
jgi:GDP-D-mannose 3',5'-epimerase